MIILDYNAKETVGELWQYDYGETLRIQGGSLQKAQEVHFSLTGTGGDSITRIGVTKDNATDVVIPDSMLENNDSEIDYLIYVFLYNRDSTSGETTKRFVLNVRSRPKPEHTGGTDGNAFGEVIEEVNKSAERAEVAERKAKEYATQTKEDAQNTADDRKEVERLVESVSDIDERVQKVNEYKEQAQTSATKALLSEQESKKAEQSALQAQAGAEIAEEIAEQHALEVARNKAETERLTTQVRQDRTSVEETAQNFDNTVQQAKEQINSISTEQINAVREVGTQEVTKVTEEGNKQVQAVEDKGQEVLQSIPKDFQTQMQSKIDKQQGIENAGKILEVGKDGIVIPSNKHLQFAIKNTVIKESSIVITDSAEEKLQDFNIFGKSTQDGVPTPDVPKEIESIGKYNADTQKYEVDINVANKNLSKNYSLNKATFDVKTGTLKNETTENTRNTKIKVQKWKDRDFVENCYVIDTLGKQEVKIQNDGSFNYIRISFDGDKEEGNIFFDLRNINALQEYILSFEVISLEKNKGIITKLMLTAKANAGDYEESKSQNIKLSLDEQLRGIGEYKDTVTKDSVIRKIKELKLDGTEEWNTWGVNDTQEGHTGFYAYYKSIDGGGNLYGTEVMSNLFKKHQNNYGEKDVGITSFSEGKDSYVSISVENTMLKDTSTNEKAIQSFKEFLLQKKEEGKQLIVYVNVLNLITEEFTEEVKQQLSSLQTYYPTTIISNDANAEMEVTYVADTKNYVDRKIKETVTAQIQNTANLLSLMPTSVQAEMIENDTNRILEEVTQ